MRFDLKVEGELNGKKCFCLCTIYDKDDFPAVEKLEKFCLNSDWFYDDNEEVKSTKGLVFKSVIWLNIQEHLTDDEINDLGVEVLTRDLNGIVSVRMV